MSIHLICLTSGGGIPIFNKKKGDCDSLPFSTIGSLNGAHMFCKSQDVDLQTTITNDGIVIWREYEDTILLIGVAKGITKKVLLDLLNLTFKALVFIIGLKELKNSRNPEKLKRVLKNCLPIVDILLEIAESELLGFTDCILCPENYDILEKLNQFAEQLGSPFCFVLIRQKVAVATEGWWTLHPTDRKLLIALLSASSTPQKDVPIYLPEKSPNIAYRLVSIPIVQGVNICVLCGAEPPYCDVENVAQLIWKNDLECLELAEQCYPRNFPSTFQMDSGILGILIINKMLGKYVFTRNIQTTSSGKRSVSGAHRLDILRTFFHQSVDIVNSYLSLGNSDVSLAKSPEAYWSSEYHKCHSLEMDGNILCVLYTATIPTHTMRLITQQTLNMIISEKDICWL